MKTKKKLTNLMSINPAAVSAARIGVLIFKTVLAVLLTGYLSVSAARAQEYAPFALNITATNFSGITIPLQFSGVAYEDSKLPYATYFNITNVPLVTLFQQLCIHTLRMGGSTSDGPDATQYGQYTVDDLFDFCATNGDLSVIFGMPLHNGNIDDDAALAQHIWTNYSSMVTAFALGNESDWHASSTEDPTITNYTTFLSRWRAFATAITNGWGRGAIFSGPATGDPFDNGAPDAANGAWAHNGIEWTTDFASDQKNAHTVIMADQHYYEASLMSGSTTDPNALIEAMLSSGWDTVTNQVMYTKMAAPVLADGLGYYFGETDESDDGGGIEGASDSFADALWTLDFMHWWAAHKCSSVCFENSQPKANNVIALNNSVFPKGYGMKAFDLGGHGYEMINYITNKLGLDVTAYVVGGAQDLYVTVVNKERSSGGTNANVTIWPKGFGSASVAEMILTAPAGMVSTNGVTLGGGTITNNAQWQGYWTDLNPETNGQWTGTVATATAAIIHFHAASVYAGPIQINSDGALEMFGIGANGDTWHNWQMDANTLGTNNSTLTNWAGWTDLGALAAGVTCVGGPAAVKNEDGTLEVFVSGSDGNVYENNQSTPGGSWGDWYNMGGEAQAQGITNLQVAVNPDGSLNLFGIGGNGDIWNNSEVAPGVGTTGWNDLSGEKIQAGFVVGQNLDGRLEVFGVDADGDVWTNSQQAAGGWAQWSGWGSLGGAVNPRIQVVRNLDGRLELFGVGANGMLNYTWQTSPGGGWASWNTTDLSGESIEPGFVVGQNLDGRFEILGVSSSDGKVYHDWITIANGNWSGWNSLGGQGTDPQLMVGSTRDGRMQVFGIDTNNNDVWSDWQTSNWSGWTNFGSTPITFYSGQP